MTVDGHIVAAYRGKDLAMKEATVSGTEYKIVAETIRELAAGHKMLPNQMQAIIWFTRKRVKRIIFDPQLDMLDMTSGAQKTTFRVEDIKPYVRN